MTRQNNLENLIFLPSLLSWCRGGQGREQENDLEEQAGGRNKGINVTTKRSRQLAECVCVCVCVSSIVAPSVSLIVRHWQILPAPVHCWC